MVCGLEGIYLYMYARPNVCVAYSQFYERVDGLETGISSRPNTLVLTMIMHGRTFTFYTRSECERFTTSGTEFYLQPSTSWAI